MDFHSSASLFPPAQPKMDVSENLYEKWGEI